MEIRMAISPEEIKEIKEAVEGKKDYLKEDIFEEKEHHKIYHGIREGMEYSGAMSAGFGDWFGTNDEEYAKQYGEVHIYEIKLLKPHLMDVIEFRKYDRRVGSLKEGFESARKYREELEKKGYDGIIVTHHDGIKEYILFDKRMAHRID